METDAFLRYCKSIADWLLAICHEWITLACGGIVMALWFGISTCWKLSMEPQQFVWIAVLFVLAGSFKAWKRERDKVLTLESVKRDAALVSYLSGRSTLRNECDESSCTLKMVGV